jgi:hypothetical protein
MFGVAIVGFFLPFITGGCERHVTLTGTQLATGQGVSAHDRAIFAAQGPIPYPPALIALTMCILGIALALLWVRSGVAASAIVGVVGLLALLFAVPDQWDPYRGITKGLHRGYGLAFVALTSAVVFDAMLELRTSRPNLEVVRVEGAHPNLPSIAALWIGIAAMGLLLTEPTRIASELIAPGAIVTGVMGARRGAPGERRAVAGYALGVAAGFIALVYLAAPGWPG